VARRAANFETALRQLDSATVAQPEKGRRHRLVAPRPIQPDRKRRVSRCLSRNRSRRKGGDEATAGRTPPEHRCQPGASRCRVFASRSVISGTYPRPTSARNMAEKLVGVRGFEPPAPASRRQCSNRVAQSRSRTGRVIGKGRGPAQFSSKTLRPIPDEVTDHASGTTQAGVG
jgi:hypothetical protein